MNMVAHRMPFQQPDPFLLTQVSQNPTHRAVDMNFGGTKKFVSGPYVPGSPLGTYGFDANTGTVWAVINYNGNFAAGILQ